MAKKVNEKKNTVDLSTKEGSIAFTLSEYHDQFDKICLDETINMAEKKKQLINFMNAYVKATAYQKKMIAKIQYFKGDNVSLLQYMYNIILAGAGMYANN